MIERLTKSNNHLVNDIFGTSLFVLLASDALRIVEAWWKMSGMTSAIVGTCFGLALWAAVLGLYRLWKG